MGLGRNLIFIIFAKDTTELQTMRKTLIIIIMTAIALNASAQIDLHSHAITKGYLDYIKANGAEMDEGFPIPAWDSEQHIAFMDKAGIQTAVLTMPAPHLGLVMRRHLQRFVAAIMKNVPH